MSWKSNTGHICKKITSGLGALRRVREFVDKDALLAIYNALVQPYFNYCCEVWDVFGATQSTRLQKLHNKAARILGNMNNDVDHKIALNALGWQPLQMQRKKSKAKIMFKVLNNMGPKGLTKYFTYKKEKSDYNLRNISNAVCLPKPRTNNMKKSFIYMELFAHRNYGEQDPVIFQT